MPGVFLIEGLSALGLNICWACGAKPVLESGIWLSALAEKNPTDSVPGGGAA